jgi:Transposase DDE domain group 1
MQMLALGGPARRWGPKRLRLRLFSAAGRIVRGGRHLRVRIAATWPWATQITAAITRLQALRLADHRQPAPTTRKETTRARGTLPAWRDSRAARHARTLKKTVSRSSRSPSQDHGRCRLTHGHEAAVDDKDLAGYV